MTFLISDVPLYLIAMPVAVVLMGKSTVIETRKFNMKPGMFFKLLLMCLPMMWVAAWSAVCCRWRFPTVKPRTA